MNRKFDIEIISRRAHPLPHIQFIKVHVHYQNDDTGNTLAHPTHIYKIYLQAWRGYEAWASINCGIGR